MRFKINIPIYKCDLIFIIKKDLSSIENEFNIKEDLSNYGAVTFKHEKEYRTFIIAIEKNSISYGLIVHELVHLVNLIYKECCIELDVINDEHQAYLMQYLFEEIKKNRGSRKSKE